MTSRRRKAAEGEPSHGRQRLRLFVACDLPRAVERAVRTWQHEELAPHEDLRVAPTLHLTLAFLGSIDAAKVPDLERILSGIAFDARGVPLPGAAVPAGARQAAGRGARARGPCRRLRDLQTRVSAGLAAEGLYEPEKRPWLPHVTVARFRRPGHPFSLQNVNIGSFGVVRMVLYSSHLERAGAVHTPVADFPAS